MSSAWQNTHCDMHNISTTISTTIGNERAGAERDHNRARQTCNNSQQSMAQTALSVGSATNKKSHQHLELLGRTALCTVTHPRPS